MEKPKKLSLADKAFIAIKKDIIENQFAPGEKLVITDLIERYGIGNCPLREALSRMAAIGLIECESMKGYRVPDFCARELKEIYSARKLIERKMLQLTVEHITEDEEAGLVAVNHQLKKIEIGSLSNKDFQVWQDKHAEFMHALFVPSRSTTLMRIQSGLYDQGERYRHLWFTNCAKHTENGLKAYSSNHQAFVDAIVARDGDQLDQAYVRKINTWLEQTVQLIEGM